MTADGKYFEPAIETLPRAQLEALQEERLLEILPYVYERSRLYREKWDAAGVHPRDIRTIEDFRNRIPFLTKDDLRDWRARHDDYTNGLLCVDPKEVSIVTSSTGSTGEPTYFFERWDYGWERMWTCMARDLWHMGIRPGDVVIAASSYRGPTHHTAQLLGAVPFFMPGGMGNWPELFSLFRELRPAYMQLGGPQVVELNQLSDRFDLRAEFASFKAVSFAGEPIGSRMRERAVRDWGLNFFVWSSAGDTGLAFECNRHDGFHLWEDTVLVEHLDPGTGRPVEDGALGELVVTAIDNRIAPLIRFRAEDLIRFDRTPCGCGRTHARMWLRGRAGDELRVGPRTVMPMDVWSAIEVLPETEGGVFQIVAPGRTLSELRVRVGYDPARTGDLADLSHRVGAAIEAATGVAPVLEMHPNEVLLARALSSKLPRVVKS
ncbi:MAG: phenylacetate--CoA ligase family protein [Gammaproteobacteria bacterium]